MRHLRLSLSLLGMVALGMSTGACDEGEGGNVCDPATLLPCDDFLEVTIRPPSGQAFLPGLYSFTAAPEGGHYMTIDCALASADATALCEPGNWDQWWVRYEAGQWLFSMPAIWTGDPTLIAPALHALSVSRDGTVLLDQSLQPDYDAFYPNGPECDDALCYQAEVTLDTTAI